MCWSDTLHQILVSLNFPRTTSVTFHRFFSNLPLSLIHSPSSTFLWFIEPSNWRNKHYLLPLPVTCFSVPLLFPHLEHFPSRIFFVLYIYIGLILLNKQLVSDWVTSFAGTLAKHPFPQIYQNSFTWCDASGRREMKSQNMSGSLKSQYIILHIGNNYWMVKTLRCVAGFLFWVWMKLGKRSGSLMKKIGVLFPTRSQLPSSV